MKKIVLSLAVVAMMSSSAAFAQKYNADALKAKIQKSDVSVADPKKNTKGATWLARGIMFNEIAMANCKDIFSGMTEAMLIETIGKPLNADNITAEKLNGVEYKKFQYNGVDIYIEESGSTIKLWLETSEVDPTAVARSVEALNKALELDPKLKDKVAEAYAMNTDYLVQKGQNNYDAGKYKEAAVLFFETAKLDRKNPKEPTLDPDNIEYFAAASAVMAEDYNFAAPLLKSLIEKGFDNDGDTQFYAGVVFDKLGDKASAEKYLKEGMEKYLENSKLLQQYIYFALTNNLGAESVLPYITKAQEKEPNNPAYFLAEAALYDQMKDYDKSIAAYDKALAIDPNNFNALYNKGFAYRAKAIAYNNEIGTLDYTNTKRIDELRGLFRDAMSQALVPLKKAHELKPTERNVLDVLKSICFTLRDESPQMMDDYKKYDAIIKGMN